MNREFFVHHAGICESENVGSGTRIWAFAHVLADAVIGMDCNICDHVFIENDVLIGNRVTLKCGVQLWDGIVLEDDVFVGPNVTFSNDLYPRSKKHPDEYLKTRIQRGASIGANATVLPGIVIGANAMVGAGAVVTKSIPANAIAVGNPAKIVGYVDAGDVLVDSTELHEEPGPAPIVASVKKTVVAGVTIHFLPAVTDIRGRLSVGEFAKDIPFKPSRFFTVFDVPTAETRGAHAHVSCHQFLIAVHGTLHVVVDDGHCREEVVLNRANIGLYLPPMTWGTQYRYSHDAVLLVFASDAYDPSDYIRDYEEFVSRVRAKLA